MVIEEDLKESIDSHIELIKNLSSLSNVQLIAFVNILSVDDAEMFNTLKEVTEWENKVLSEFIKESEHANEKKKNEHTNEKKKNGHTNEKKKNEHNKKHKKEHKKKPKKEAKRTSEDMFEPSQYDRVQIGGEKQ